MVTLCKVLYKQSQLTIYTIRLNYKVEKLKEEEDILVYYKLLNIKEIEYNKVSLVLNPNGFLFNISSKRFDPPISQEDPNGINQSTLISSRTPKGIPYSSL